MIYLYYLNLSPMHQKIPDFTRSIYSSIPFHIFILTSIIALVQWYNHSIFGDPDSQYHLTIAKIMPLWPRSTSFFWLPFTSWGSAFADQHYLFHVYLKPFALLNIGQVAIVLGFVGNMLAFNWLLKQVTHTTRAPWLWLYALGSADVFVRINMARAESTSMIFLFLCTGLLLKKRWAWLVPLMSVYMLWYGGGTVFLFFISVYCLVESVRQRTVVIKPFLFVLVGILLAFIIHPYRTTLPALLYDQITTAGFLRHIPGGSEWYRHRAFFLIDNILIFLPWVASMFYLIHKRTVSDWKMWFFGICSIVLLKAGLDSARMLLYWVPYAILFTSLVAESSSIFSKVNIIQTPKPNLRKILILTLAACICIRIAQNIYGSSTTIHRMGVRVDRLKSAAEWLKANTKPGDVIVNAIWDIFPELFYWNQQNRYIAGEDPAFLWIGDAERYKQWKNLQITPPDPQTFIHVLRAFHSHWLIIPAEFNIPTSGTRLTSAYRDAQARILYLEK